MSLERCIKLSRYFFGQTERPNGVLENQIKQAEEVVGNLVTRPLLPFQREALVCLVSDIVGGYASSPSVMFQDSFLLKAVNKGMFQIATAEFAQFCYCDGALNARAWQKRKAEQLLFSRGQLLFS